MASFLWCFGVKYIDLGFFFLIFSFEFRLMDLGYVFLAIIWPFKKKKNLFGTFWL
jgi:hypothetical protein